MTSIAGIAGACRHRVVAMDHPTFLPVEEGNKTTLTAPVPSNLDQAIHTVPEGLDQTGLPGDLDLN